VFAGRAAARPFKENLVGIMRIIDSTGDTVIDWQVGDPVSTTEAEALFNRLQSERQMPFGRSTGAAAKDATLLRSFDAELEEIVWVRPVQGG
jgi:hypothetical protein